MEQERRADVVRQIPDHTEIRPERAEVEAERVGLMQCEDVSRESIAQSRREIAVDLDRSDASSALD